MHAIAPHPKPLRVQRPADREKDAPDLQPVERLAQLLAAAAEAARKP